MQTIKLAARLRNRNRYTEQRYQEPHMVGEKYLTGLICWVLNKLMKQQQTSGKKIRIQKYWMGKVD